MCVSPRLSDGIRAVEWNSEVEFFSCVSYRLDAKFSDFLCVSLSAVKLSLIVDVGDFLGVESSFIESLSDKDAGLFHDNRTSRLKFVVNPGMFSFTLNKPTVNALDPNTLGLD